MKRKKKNLQFIITVVLILLLLCGCDFGTKPYTKSGFALDTVVSITVYEKDHALADAALEEAFQLCMSYDRMFGISDPSGDVYRLNHAGGEPVTVSEDTYTLLQKSIAYSEMSDGLLDVTIQPLYELWDFQNTENREPPSGDQILLAKQKVDYHNICLLDNCTVMLKDDATINLGAIAKGYIADRLKEMLLERGITSALINLGGNIQTIGEKPDGSPFQIGLATPFDENGAILTDVPVKDRSVVTSGIYQRYFESGGEIYHHILDPGTGYPAKSDLNAAVIITDASVDADALSTICMLMGSEKAKAFLSSIPDTQFVLIDRNNQIL